MILFLQGSAVTHTVLGGLTIYPIVVNFLLYLYTKKLWICFRVDKAIAMTIRSSFLDLGCCACGRKKMMYMDGVSLMYTVCMATYDQVFFWPLDYAYFSNTSSNSTHTHCFNGHFPDKPWLAVCALILNLSHSYPECSHGTGWKLFLHFFWRRQTGLPTGYFRLYLSVARWCSG